jgi:hypothetical protein
MVDLRLEVRLPCLGGMFVPRLAKLPVSIPKPPAAKPTQSRETAIDNAYYPIAIARRNEKTEQAGKSFPATGRARCRRPKSEAAILPLESTLVYLPPIQVIFVSNENLDEQ